MPLKIESFGKTDIGLVRKGNEDCFLIDSRNSLYVVCDGMGGHQAGEVASHLSANTVGLAFKKLADDLRDDTALAPGHTLPSHGDLLVRAIRLANRRVYNRASGNLDQSGMGTTIVGIAVEDDLMSVAHVGDSRAYRLDEKAVTPLTQDHSWTSEIQKAQDITEEEANQLVGRNIITRALGVKENVEVDYRQVKVKPGEIFILCSDGLCGFASDVEIFEVADHGRDKLERIVEGLVKLANDKGGNDNVTIVAIEIVDIHKSKAVETEAVTFPAESKELLKAEDGWLDKIENMRSRDNTDNPGPQAPSTKFWLLTLAAVVVVAAVIILGLTYFN